MTSFKININSDSVVTFTNNLEKLHRSALPVAIRQTLTATAFLMKKETLPQSGKKNFIQRQPNFFKANSKAFPAQGFDINTMSSTVAMLSSGLHNESTNFAVKDLQQQEKGGTIHGRSFKPLPSARKGGRGVTKANERIREIRLKAGNIIVANHAKGANKMQQFIKSAIHAGVGGYVLNVGSAGRGGILFKIKSLKRTAIGSTRFKMDKMYTFKKSGVAKVTATGFMREAAFEVQKEMEFLYKLEATKQFKKAGLMT